MKWFSDEQPTKEAAQELHRPRPLDFFSPAFIAQTPDRKFVMGALRLSRQWPPEWIEDFQNIINEEWGYTIVSLCDPLLGMWKDYDLPTHHNPFLRRRDRQ